MIWLVLQAAAITLVLTEGSIFARLRTFGPALWRQLVSCPLCLGVWIGMGLYVLHWPSDLNGYYAVEVLGFGCVSGVLAFLGAQLIACLDRWSGPDPEALPAPQAAHPYPSTPPKAKKPQGPDVRILKEGQVPEKP